MEFTFSSKAKVFTFILMGLGAILIGLDVVINGTEGQRFWANLYTNGFFWMAISLGALFFIALQYATESAWGVLFKRVLEGVMSFLPIGLLVIVVVLLAGFFHGHHLFHWMDASVYDPTSEHFDLIIANKVPYLGVGGDSWFFWVRTIAYVGTFLIFMVLFRKWSLQEDKAPDLKLHFKMYRRGALFLVFFAVFSSTLSWDWLMAIDTHWFSTLYGWYIFSGMWVTAVIVTLMFILYLKNKGYLPNVNENHIHDMGKWMFAISILWAYLWFSQFMLIWYADIPEEVSYFVERFHDYKVPFLTMFFVNLIFPLIILMSRDAKRNNKFLIVIGLIILCGHFIDMFIIVMPGTMHGDWQFSFLEFGMPILFAGVFIHVVLRTLTKAPLTPVNHPYLDEVVHFHQ